MAKLTRSQIRANRIKWAKYLQDPEREKATGVLEGKEGGFCCLGHGCVAFEIERWVDDVDDHINYGAKYPDPNDLQAFDAYTAPTQLIDLLGLSDSGGRFIASPSSNEYMHSYEFNGVNIDCLTALNDSTSCTPQQIGMWLEDCVEGGPGTPFWSLNTYPEEV